MPDMKVEKNQDHSKFFGYLLELNVEIWRFEKKIFSKFGEF
jgi:hypothetical protein